MIRTMLTAAVCGLACQAALAGEPGRADDEKAIRQMAADYQAAYNRGDAKTVAGQFALAAELVHDDGRITRGRDAIEPEIVTLFEKNPGARIEVVIHSIRFVRPDVAIEHGTAVVTSPAGNQSQEDYTALHAKEKGAWKINHLQETVAPPAASPYDHLRPLEWLIGHWVDESGGSIVRTECDWTANRSFLRRSFEVSIKGRLHLSGTEVIGWDPIAGQIRSWVFDSSGAFAEGVWTCRDGRWTLRLSGVTEHGQKASAVCLFTPIDDNAYTWRAVSRELDGQLLPEIDQVTVRRRPAAGSPQTKESK